MGVIKGESQDANHKEWIEIYSFNWGASQSGSLHVGGGGGAGTASLQDLSLVKRVDASTPFLLERVFTGQPFAEGTIKFTEVVDGKARTIMDFKLTPVLVTSVSAGASSGAEFVGETLSLNFESMEETVYYFNPSESGESTVVWDQSEMEGSTDTSGSPNSAPTISQIANQTTSEDSPKAASFTVNDSESANGALTVARGTNNPTLLPVNNIVVSGSGGSRTVTMTPAANRSGSVTVTLTVSDGQATAPMSFQLTVNAVNDEPTVAAIATQVTDENVEKTETVWIGDIDNAFSEVSMSGTSDNVALIPNGNVTFSGTGNNRTMTLTPAADQFGQANITVTATDPGGANSAPRTFLFAVNSASGQAPTNITLSAATVPENSAVNTVVGTLTVTDEDFNETHTLSLVNNPGGLFSIGGTSENELRVASSELDFESNPTPSVTVKALDSDNLMFTKVFTISVSNMNEAPVIVLTNPGLVEAQTSHAIATLSVSDPDAGGSDLTVVISVSNGVLTIDESGVLSGKVTNNGSAAVTITAPFADLNSVLGAGGLTYVSDLDFVGQDTLALTAGDAGASGSGSAQSASASVNFQVFAEGFESFRIEHFTAAELGDPAISGALADADGDGMANLAEYAVGGNPKNRQDASGLVEFITVEVEGVKYRAVRFERPPASADPSLTVEVQVTSDLNGWLSGASHTTIVSTTPLDSPFDEVTIRSNLPLNDPSNQFMRVKATLAE
jgi:type VI secretion system Hcp family effector